MKPFQLSPAEQRGYFILLAGLVILLIVRSLPEKRTFYDVSVYLPDDEISTPSSRGERSAQAKMEAVRRSEPKPGRVLNIPQAFDPNYLSAREMYGHGFPESWIDNILQYKRKHGYIENAADFQLACAGDSAMRSALMPHLAFRHEPKRRKIERHVARSTDLNKASAVDLTSIFGVGTVLAERILKFRNGLGGFASKDQLYEVYGLDSAVVERIRSTFELNNEVERLDINSANEEQLRAHPYISYRMAGSLVKYREQHGAFDSIGALSALYNWKSESILKLRPYLRTGQPGL